MRLFPMKFGLGLTKERILIAISLCLLAVPSSNAEDSALKQLIDSHFAQLQAIQSDQQAQSFFSQELAPAFEISEASQLAKAQSLNRQVSPSGTMDAVWMIAQLVKWSLSNALQKGLEYTEQDSSLHQLLEQSQAQRKWLEEKGAVQQLNPTIAFAETFMALNKFDAPTQSELSQYDQYVTYLDQHYPLLTGSKDSWLSHAQQHGTQGTIDRLTEFWTNPESSAHRIDRHMITTPIQRQYAERYLHTYLLPLFKAHLIAQLILVQAESEHQVWQAWGHLRKRKDSVQNLQALNRLCGTWKWTVHNHQNHRDHKMTLSFPPADNYKSMQPWPSMAVALGDTLYLRWNFPAGYQEDSLIFSNDDRQLEGTFRNSAGPQGSISGRRLTSCQQ